MAQGKTVISPLLTHGRYCSLAVNTLYVMSEHCIRPRETIFWNYYLWDQRDRAASSHDHGNHWCFWVISHRRDTCRRPLEYLQVYRNLWKWACFPCLDPRHHYLIRRPGSLQQRLRHWFHFHSPYNHQARSRGRCHATLRRLSLVLDIFWTWLSLKFDPYPQRLVALLGKQYRCERKWRGSRHSACATHLLHIDERWLAYQYHSVWQPFEVRRQQRSCLSPNILVPD